MPLVAGEQVELKLSPVAPNLWGWNGATCEAVAAGAKAAVSSGATATAGSGAQADASGAKAASVAPEPPSSSKVRVLIGGGGSGAVDPDGESYVSCIGHFLSPAEAGDLYRTLQTELSWSVATDDFGPQDRGTAYFADPGCTFCYVGHRCEPRPWPACLAWVRDRLNERLGARHGGVAAPVTACLACQYEAGRGALPWHFDEMRAHGKAEVVVSVSLGLAPRFFELRRQGSPTEEPELRVSMEPGSALVMGGGTQREWLHRLPVEDGDPAPHRISLTFRSIVPGFEDGLGADATAQMSSCKDR